MKIWGSVADWINVLIALIAFIGFLIVERDRLSMSIKKYPGQMNNDSTSVKIEDGMRKKPDKSIEIRSMIYSRVFLGLIIGLFLNRLWLGQITLYMSSKTETESIREIETVIALFISIFVSVLFTVLFYKPYGNLKTLFVKFVERLFISAPIMVLIMQRFYGYYYYINSGSDNGYTVYSDNIEILSVFAGLFVLLSFQSTPIDWVIALATKKNSPSNSK